MMLVTFTWVPPSCSARLPQKFSAATTLIVAPPDELVVAVLGEVEQPASASVISTAAAAAQCRSRRRAVPGGRVEDTASLREGVATVAGQGNDNGSRVQMRCRHGRV